MSGTTETGRGTGGGAGWILAAVGVVVLAVLTIWLGMAIMPTRERAASAGTIVPWFVTWGLILVTALVAVVIAANIAINGRADSASR